MDWLNTVVAALVIGYTAERVARWFFARELNSIRKSVGWKTNGSIVVYNGTVLHPEKDFREQLGKIILEFNVYRGEDKPDNIVIVRGPHVLAMNSLCKRFDEFVVEPPPAYRPTERSVTYIN